MISSFALFNGINYNKEEYTDFSDLELVYKARDKDEYAEMCLYIRYMYLVKRIISSFFIIGGTQDDLFQEAMIGLIKAIKSFNGEHNCSFKHYVEICIRRQIITVIRKTSVNEVAINYITVYNCLEWKSDYICESEYYKMDNLNPETLILNRENNEYYYEIIFNLLSKFEKKILEEYFNEKSYEEISLSLNKNSKSIDNALQRIRKKIYISKEKIAL